MRSIPTFQTTDLESSMAMEADLDSLPPASISDHCSWGAGAESRLTEAGWALASQNRHSQALTAAAWLGDAT